MLARLYIRTNKSWQRDMPWASLGRVSISMRSKVAEHQYETEFRSTMNVTFEVSFLNDYLTFECVNNELS